MGGETHKLSDKAIGLVLVKDKVYVGGGIHHLLDQATKFPLAMDEEYECGDTHSLSDRTTGLALVRDNGQQDREAMTERLTGCRIRPPGWC